MITVQVVPLGDNASPVLRKMVRSFGNCPGIVTTTWSATVVPATNEIVGQDTVRSLMETPLHEAATGYLSPPTFSNRFGLR